MLTRISILLLLLLSVATTAADTAAASNANAEGPTKEIFHLRAQAHKKQTQSVLCRVITLRASFRVQPSDRIGKHEETTACVPIVDGQETDQEHVIALPSDIHEQNLADIRQGRLLVEINGAQLVDEKLDLGDSPKFEVINDPDHPARRQLQDYGFTVGDKTIAIVRIHTNDASPEKSLDELENVYLNNAISVRSQFRSCSFDQVIFSLAARNGKLDVYVDASVDDYASAGQLWTDANKQLKEDLGFSTPELADRVIFCMPPNEAWGLAAVASLNHWKVVMANQFCTSLSGVMHEMGHSMGLLHANEDGVEYGDVTGYMGYGQPEEDGPLECFNAQNHDHFGWFSDHTFHWDWSMEPKKISLAAFVDYDLTSSDEYVIASLDDKYFLQYNSATKFNSGTREYANDLVVVEQLPEGSQPSGTNVIGTLRESSVAATRTLEIDNYLGSGEDLILEVCERIASAQGSEPNLLVVSIGLGSSICGESTPTGPRPTSPPTRRPTPPATKPNLEPSTAPPTRRPTSSPTEKPAEREESPAQGQQNPCSELRGIRAFFCRLSS